MNLYTKLWLKFAPKGYRGIAEREHEKIFDECGYWKSKCEYWIGENEEKARRIRKLEDNFKICETDKEFYQERSNCLEKKNASLRDSFNRLQRAYHTLVNSYEMICGGVT